MRSPADAITALVSVGRLPQAVPAQSLPTVVVAAGEPFAVTSYARARLLRQLHAAGVLINESTRGAPT